MNWITLTGVILTFLAAVFGYLQTRRKIAEVHVLVNSQLHDVIDRVSQLTKTLDDHGIDLPPRKS